MIKVAFFVEGQTEQIFIERLIQWLANSRGIRIVSQKWYGPKKERVLAQVNLVDPTGDPDYLFQIRDCGSDTAVLSDARDECAKLETAGVSQVVCVRDIQGQFVYNQRTAARVGMEKTLASLPLPATLILATMETEAWFLAEDSHFAKIHPGLVAPRVSGLLGYALSAVNLEAIDKPSEALNAIYSLEELTYDKSRAAVQRTVDVLDFHAITSTIHAKVPAIEPLILCVRNLLR